MEDGGACDKDLCPGLGDSIGIGEGHSPIHLHKAAGPLTGNLRAKGT